MIKKIVFILIMAFTIYVQTGSEFEDYLHDLSKQFAIEQIQADSVNLSDNILLDTREKDEFAVSHIQNAVWVGYNDFDISQIDSIDREHAIIVYCSVGYRSSKIGLTLKKAGFKNVKNLYGGIFNWVNEKRSIYNYQNRTFSLHAYSKKWGRFIINPKIIKVY
jgi:rhodanese-related sulfurtransferase